MSQARKMLLSSHTIQEGFVSTGNWRRRSFSEAMQSVFGLKRKAVMWFLILIARFLCWRGSPRDDVSCCAFF